MCHKMLCTHKKLASRTPRPSIFYYLWVSYQVRTVAGCACAGNAGNVFPRRRLQRKPLVSDPGMHHATCYPRLRGKRSRHSRRMRTHSFTYLARGPWPSTVSTYDKGRNIYNVFSHWLSFGYKTGPSAKCTHLQFNLLFVWKIDTLAKWQTFSHGFFAYFLQKKFW